jgi:hypothetical protein
MAEAQASVTTTRALSPDHRSRRRSACLIACAASLVGALVACSTTTAQSPAATWPSAPERLPDPTLSSQDALLTCGGRPFPSSSLEAPTGAENEPGPEFDALRWTIATFHEAFPESGTWTWQLAGRDDAEANFLSRPASGTGPPDWFWIEVTADGSGWKPGSMGTCELRVVLSTEFGPASWALNPAFGSPSADTTELQILVWERACSSGSPATGRMSAPVIDYGADTVTITIGVRPLQVEPGAGLSCPMPPGTPASVRLSEPLGERTLLDGGVLPPAPPSPANG